MWGQSISKKAWAIVPSSQEALESSLALALTRSKMALGIGMAVERFVISTCRGRSLRVNDVDIRGMVSAETELPRRPVTRKVEN